MASIYLDEKAFQWHWTLMRARRRHVIGWEEYSKAIKKRFGPTYEVPMVELMWLRQAGNIGDYNDAFDAVMCKTNLTEDYVVQIYVEDLQEWVAEHVRLLKPATLQHARARLLARLQEINLVKAFDGYKGVDETRRDGSSWAGLLGPPSCISQSSERWKETKVAAGENGSNFINGKIVVSQEAYSLSSKWGSVSSVSSSSVARSSTTHAKVTKMLNAEDVDDLRPKIPLFLLS